MAGQAYLVFGEEAYLGMFVRAYRGAMQGLRAPGSSWLGEADMDIGEPVLRPWVSSLSAFWPGLQVCLPACLCVCLGGVWEN